MIKFYFFVSSLSAEEISFTIDDPEVSDSYIFTPEERNNRILKAFSDHKIKGALFVCGMRIDGPLGKKIISAWDDAGHVIGNHSYSHLSLNRAETNFDVYKNDFLRVEPLISEYKNFMRLYRFPYLKEGDTKERRDAFRNFLKEKGYKNAHVTIDASDWFINLQLKDKLSKNPKADLTPYKNYYLAHIWDRANYYNDLAKKAYPKDIKHTLLIHHNLLNALFLGDLIEMFKDKGWKVISAKEAFSDPIYEYQSDIVPAGESFIWGIAKESGKFDNILKYPGENVEKEKLEMTKLGL